MFVTTPNRINSLFSVLLLVSPFFTRAQDDHSAETIQYRFLDSVTVRSYLANRRVQALPDLQGTAIFSGKNTWSVLPDGNRANLAGNQARTALAQIPGLNLWEMDGAGTQLNIGNRGTDPHRSIEMNMRQNGYVTSSDIFGYPENHYTVPLQGVESIQFVRGAAALQYGSQFGGMMNFVLKHGDSTKPIAIETEQTAGSKGLYNSFTSLGGTSGRWNYYAYYDNRHGNGWRPNARFDYHAYHASIRYAFSTKASLRLEFSRMDYTQQIAGGLTNAQFNENARQSFRSRNFFMPEINLPAALFKWDISDRTKLEVSSHMLIGQRNSVQFINTPNIMDTVNPALQTYNPRQVDRDYYNAFTTEARLLHQYRLGAASSTLSGGLRYSDEKTRREQKGVGTTANDPDLTLTKPYGIDLHFRTRNVAVFAENRFLFGNRFSVTPGLRYEVIHSELKGLINAASFPVSYAGKRGFPLFGTGLQFNANAKTEFYGNISQAYRPYLYASFTPADQIGQIDPALKDSRGYDIDLGYRGQVQDLLNFNVNGFYLYTGNRAGQLTLTKPDNSTYLYTTNIGNAVAAGVESYADLSLYALFGASRKNADLRIFNSLAYTHGRYISGQISNNGKNVALKDKHLESTPEWIDRAGLQLFYRTFTTSLQYSYTSYFFSDANNTEYNPTGATGIIPAYHVWDWTATMRFMRIFHVSVGVNNVGNAKYFTRRINMYPGPGILPADGRSMYVSLGVKL